MSAPLTIEQLEIATTMIATLEDGIADCERASRPAKAASIISAWNWIVVRRASASGTYTGLRMLGMEPFTYNFSGQTPGTTSHLTEKSARNILGVLQADRDPADDAEYCIMPRRDFFQIKAGELRQALLMVMSTVGERI